MFIQHPPKTRSSGLQRKTSSIGVLRRDDGFTVIVIRGENVNIFAEALVPPTVETTILTYNVPGGQTLQITGLVGWGNYDGEFYIRVNGVQKGGCRNSPSDRTEDIDYTSGTIDCPAGSTVTVAVEHYAPGPELFRTNLLAKLI